MTYAADYRQQKGGLKNSANTTIYGTPPGGVFGGTIGEKMIQYFTEPWQDPASGQQRVKSIDVAFEVVQDLATTWYPPFSWHHHELVWHAPFDMEIGLMTIHSHHRNVRGFIDIVPANPIRDGYSDEYCGGSKPEFGETPEQALLQAEHVLENVDWEDARICEYWRNPDGPLVLRKGQAVRTTCYVNNGITPEAIKHGLVAGAAVEGMRNVGIEIPPDPSTMPTSEWSPFLIDSPLGQEYLYGPRVTGEDPSGAANFRVVYKCGPGPGLSSPTGAVCKPDPDAIDADGDYIDGPWKPTAASGICPAESPWCNPGTIRFANVGEDEMCIPVFMYWPLDRLGGPGSENAEASLEAAAAAAAAGDADGAEENLNDTGTPGSIPKQPGDIGDCRDCSRVPTL
jgi:hypothetical protein